MRNRIRAGKHLGGGDDLREESDDAGSGDEDTRATREKAIYRRGGTEKAT